MDAKFCIRLYSNENDLHILDDDFEKFEQVRQRRSNTPPKI